MVNSEANRAFGVNPSLLSSNKCRPHLSTYITHKKVGRGGAKFVIEPELREGGQK